MGSKYEQPRSRMVFRVSCKDMGSKYGRMLGYDAHVRRILAGLARNPYLEPISQHETGKSPRGARIWPPSTSHCRRMQGYGLQVRLVIAECRNMASKYEPTPDQGRSAPALLRTSLHEALVQGLDTDQGGTHAKELRRAR